MQIVDKKTDLSQIDFQAGAMLLIDKPLNWTSFDVVKKIRYALKFHLNVKKFKVGHAGTLDPLATGLLILCTGKATKKIDSIQGLFKSYDTTIKLGATTKSYDAEFEEENITDYSEIAASEVRDCVSNFIGEIDQMPPDFSALKIDGKASYKWARKGVKKELKSRKITIHDIKIDRIELPNVYFCVDCSKGTYIRSLAHDIGQKLEVGAYLTGLRRLAIGEYSIDDAWDLATFVDEIKNLEQLDNVNIS